MRKINLISLIFLLLVTPIWGQSRLPCSKSLLAISFQSKARQIRSLGQGDISPDRSSENREIITVFNVGKAGFSPSNQEPALIKTAKSPAETLKYDTDPYWGFYANVPYWAVRFTSTSENPVRAALIFLWAYRGTPASCSLYVWDWDTLNNWPGEIKIGPIPFTAVTQWQRIDLPQPYFDGNDFAIGYFLPLPSGADTTLAVSDQYANFPDRSWIGNGAAWSTFQSTGGAGDICIRAIVDKADHDVKPVNIIAPEKFVKSNTIIPPQAIIKNMGTNAETLDVTMRIEGTSLYSCTKNINIPPGSEKEITFENWASPSVNEIAGKATLYTELAKDQNLQNDTLKSFVQTSRAKILLLSDEYDGHNVPEYWDSLYARIIEYCGFDSTGYDIWNYPEWGGVRNELLGLYDVIIWHTGTSNGNPASSICGGLSLNLDDRTGVIQWLESGSLTSPKNLCLSGMWIPWNTIADADNGAQLADSLFDRYFYLRYPKENFTDWIRVDNLWKLEAVSGGFITTNSIPLYWRSQENFPDQLEAIPGFSQGEINWLDSTNTAHHLAGISYDGGYFKTVLFTCPFEGMFQPETIMADMLKWFGVLTGIEVSGKPELPITNYEFKLGQNTPNPFKQRTMISYQLPKAGQVSLKIYNINGQLVKTLVDRVQRAGEHSVKWDGRDESGQAVASGVYLYQIKAGKQGNIKKMIILK
ncbi:T9SS type A sorting domain-containing protein [candidate division TA06 bacterium]|uniref:T9SS type A sorting domain-containing protein n=1 Tax=candidate division TA06 bacterium TaxID=2250710 RepID=A0A933IAF2_UNCT6|nr:T9SS type A sorting domain-containing protein [candidate division TA06 bacterium]